MKLEFIEGLHDKKTDEGITLIVRDDSIKFKHAIDRPKSPMEMIHDSRLLVYAIAELMKEIELLKKVRIPNGKRCKKK